MKKIAMFGICGKMGTSISREMLEEKEIELVGGFDFINTDERMIQVVEKNRDGGI